MTTPAASDRSVTALVVTVLAGYALLTYAAIAPGLNLVGVLLGLVLTLGVLAVQLGVVSRPGVRRSRETTAVALLALACLVYVPVVALSVGWIAFAGFLAGSLLVLLPSRVGLAGAAVVVVSVGLLVGLVGGAPVLAVVTTMVGTVVTGLVVLGLTRLWAITTARDPAPGAAAGVAAEVVPEPTEALGPDTAEADAPEADAPEADAPEPRAVRSGAEPEVAGSEAEHEAVGREDPDVVEPGSRTRSTLAEELAVARTELTGAEVELSVLGADVELPGPVAESFAALLRVAVGHAARHAGAASCHVTIVRRGGEARIVVTHDGATDDPAPEDFEALGERFDAADGSVLAERDDEQFTVDGRLPIPA